MMKILLVDDDAFLRDMYALKFSQHEHVVDTAASAAEALRKVEKNPDFDVILLDMVMPGMSGLDLIKTIKEHFPETKAKCVVLSNQGIEDDIEDAKKAGAAGYIIKAEMIPSDVVKRVEDLVSK